LPELAGDKYRASRRVGATDIRWLQVLKSNRAVSRNFELFFFPNADNLLFGKQPVQIQQVRFEIFHIFPLRPLIGVAVEITEIFTVCFFPESEAHCHKRNLAENRSMAEENAELATGLAESYKGAWLSRVLPGFRQRFMKAASSQPARM